MIFNKLYNTTPKFIHAAGKPEFLPLWPEIKSLPLMFRTACPSNLTIVTYNSGPVGYNGKTNGLFEKSLVRAGVENFVVLGHGIKHWMNKLKIDLLQSYLSSVTTEYLLSSDSSDVILVGPLDGIVEEFNTFKCQMLFNAEQNIWPTDLEQNIVNFELSKAGAFIAPFLNAGLWLARTDFLRQHLHELHSYEFTTKHIMSEQIYYKYFYYNHPEIKLDFTCKLFQNINRVGEGIIDTRG